MKLLRVLGLLAAFLAPSFGQTDRVDLTADKLVHDAALVRGLGHARARVGDLVLQADEATLRNQTGELELRGHVHIVLPAREDHTLFRYGSGNLLTSRDAFPQLRPVGQPAHRSACRSHRRPGNRQERVAGSVGEYCGGAHRPGIAQGAVALRRVFHEAEDRRRHFARQRPAERLSGGAQLPAQSRQKSGHAAGSYQVRRPLRAFPT